MNDPASFPQMTKASSFPTLLDWPSLSPVSASFWLFMSILGGLPRGPGGEGGTFGSTKSED